METLFVDTEALRQVSSIVAATAEGTRQTLATAQDPLLVADTYGTGPMEADVANRVRAWSAQTKDAWSQLADRLAVFAVALQAARIQFEIVEAGR